MAEFKPILLTLPSLTPSLAVEVLPHGLTLHRVFVQADGRTHDIVIGPESPSDHVTQKYTNTIVGRYSNRIPVKTHTLERHGITSEFVAQANENPKVSLHGGPKGFDAVPWTLLTPENPPTLFSQAEIAAISASSTGSSQAVFRLESSDGDQGYPGKLILEALVALIAPGDQQRIYQAAGESATPHEHYDLGSIVLVYRAKLDEGEKKVVTPVNLTQHWGFNLDASLKEGSDPLSVKDHTLSIKADRISELDEIALPTGSFISTTTADSPHAHDAKRIGDKFPEKGYDDYYAFTAAAAPNIPSRIPLNSFTPESDLLKDLLKGTRTDTLVELSSAKSGLKLLFDSNQHGVMFYSNNLAKATNGARKKIHGGSGISGNGDAYAPGTAVFLEFHNALAAFLDPKNKDAEDTLLTSDELYHNYVRVDVKFKEPRL
ncbi:galactose mutarotase-like protein [Pluteus cervinus]|uniref:Galactose mutarotase-like protein n=1 Tax=Pluteus cervinus TaxID=181527 RepID=A0ACD3AH84_9AGAR|nr:galactose mutarotase-like protein [Pluteus cervinus]